MSFDLVIRGGTVVTAERTLRADVGIEGEKIARIARGVSGSDAATAAVVTSIAASTAPAIRPTARCPFMWLLLLVPAATPNVLP